MKLVRKIKNSLLDSNIDFNDQILPSLAICFCWLDHTRDLQLPWSSDATPITSFLVFFFVRFLFRWNSFQKNANIMSCYFLLNVFFFLLLNLHLLCSLVVEMIFSIQNGTNILVKHQFPGMAKLIQIQQIFCDWKFIRTQNIIRIKIIDMVCHIKNYDLDFGEHGTCILW